MHIVIQVSHGASLVALDGLQRRLHLLCHHSPDVVHILHVLVILPLGLQRVLLALVEDLLLKHAFFEYPLLGILPAMIVLLTLEPQAILFLLLTLHFRKHFLGVINLLALFL